MINNTLTNTFSGTEGMPAVKVTIGANPAHTRRRRSLSSIRETLLNIEDDTENIINKLSTLCSGYDIQIHFDGLTKVIDECGKLKKIVTSLQKGTSNHGYENMIDEYVGNSDYFCTFTQKADRITIAQKDIIYKIDELIKSANTSKAEVNMRLHDETLCEEVLCDKEEEIKERANDTYNRLEKVGMIDEYMEKANNFPLEQSMLPYEELYYNDHTDFAVKVANDKSVTDEHLSDFLFNEIMKHIDSNGKKYAWLLKKWRSRTGDIDKFIAMCLRLCCQKMKSWSRITNLIFAWLEEHEFVNGKGAKTKFIYYLREMNPDADIKPEDITKNCKVNAKDKNLFYPQFDTCYNLTIAC